MNIKASTGIVIAGSLAAVPVFAKKPAEKVASPNVVIILADDMGYGDVNYLNAKSQIPTPNLDRLASNGIVFTEAHSGSAVSTPSRYGLLTGRYCFRTRLKEHVLCGYAEPLIEPGRRTVAGLLSDAGYETAVIGKWHLGLGWPLFDESDSLHLKKTYDVPDNVANIDFNRKLTDSPNDHGFDYSYIIPASLDMSPYVCLENGEVVDKNFTTIGKCNSPRGVFYREGPISESFSIEHNLSHMHEKAVEYIRSTSDDKPFFLYYALTAPHTPWFPEEEFCGRSGAGRYGDFVCQVDQIVGDIVNVLREKGIEDNTIIIFTSDNGADWLPSDKKAYPFHKANYIFRGEKTDIWDGGHHVPFIVQWKDHIQAGRSYNGMICLTDIMSTCAEMTGQELAENEGEDSFSFYNVLLGDKMPVRNSVVHHSVSGMFALRTGQWKFVDGIGSGGKSRYIPSVDEPAGQLYDMINDVEEKNNVFSEYPDIVEQMNLELRQIIDSGSSKYDR